jgi:choline-sulfatase
MSIKWLEQASSGDQPFFLRVSHLWPHTPVLVPEPWHKAYDPEELPFRPFNREVFEARSLFDQEFFDTQQCADLSVADWRRIQAVYYGLCAYVDYEVGRLLQALEALGLRERTLIAFNSDHGKSLGEIGLSEKGNFDREVWRVPFILAGPGVAQEQDHRGLCELLDFGPTLTSLAGVELPSHMRGRDLFHSVEPEAVFGIIDLDGQRRAAVRTHDFRYDCTLLKKGRAVASEASDPNLINVRADPHEKRNLIRDPEYASQAIRLHRLIELWLEEASAPDH